MVGSIGSNSGERSFGSYHPHSVSQASVISVPGDLTPFAGLARDIHINTFKNKYNYCSES